MCLVFGRRFNTYLQNDSVFSLVAFFFALTYHISFYDHKSFQCTACLCAAEMGLFQCWYRKNAIRYCLKCWIWYPEIASLCTYPPYLLALTPDSSQHHPVCQSEILLQRWPMSVVIKLIPLLPLVFTVSNRDDFMFAVVTTHSRPQSATLCC